MKKKLCILTWRPLYKWDFIRLDLKELKRKYDIKIFDISAIIFNNDDIKQLYKKRGKIKSFTFKNTKSAILAIKKNKFNLIINLTGIHKNHPIYKELLTKKVKILSFIDFQLNNHFFFPKIIKLYFKYFLKKFFNLFKKKTDEIVIVGGDNLSNKFHSIGSKVIYSHSINYDYLLRNKRKINEKVLKKSIAYIDSGLGLHPDFYLTKGINSDFNIVSFSNKLNLLFKKLNEFGYKVYFLANPKIPKKKQNIYKNCKIIYYKTPEYIKKSELVIFSISSTIEYGIIFKKKLLRIFSKEVNAYPINVDQHAGFDNFFSTSALDLDKEITKKNIQNKIILPSKKYNKFFSKFIKHPKSINLKFLDIIEKLAS